LWLCSAQDPIDYVAVDAHVHQLKGSSSRLLFTCQVFLSSEDLESSSIFTLA
jgi:hypothetical protein